MGILFIYLLLLATISVVPMLVWPFVFKKRGISITTKKVVIFATLFSLILLLTEIVLSFWNYHLIGYKTGTIVLILFCLFFTTSYLTASFKNKTTKRVLELILFFTIFSTSTVSLVNLTGYSDNLLFVDSKYRLQTFTFLSSPVGILPDLYLKKGLVEKKIKLIIEQDWRNLDESKLFKKEIVEIKIKESSGIFKVFFYHENGDSLIVVTR